MPHNLLILGNGFDLDMGYKTKYSDFVNSNLWPFKEKDLTAIGIPNLQNYIYDFTEQYKKGLGQVRWIDIEQLLRDYALSKQNPDTFNNEIVEADKRAYELLVDSFAEYIREELYKGRKSFYTLCSSYQLVDAISQSSKTWKGYTFNYTPSKDIIFFILNEKKGVKFELPLFHIHGKVDMSSGANSIILGIDDVEIPKEYKFLRKSWNKDFEPHTLDDDLVNADQIVFFGLSFGQIDREYFRDFFKAINENYRPGQQKRGLHFITYNESSRIDIMENLEAIGIPVARLKKAMDFHFYLTDRNDKDHVSELDKFKNLCLQLQG